MLSKTQIENLIDTLKFYDLGKYIYPGVIKRRLQITSAQAYAILGTIERMGIVKGCFEVNCFECSKTIGDVYENLSDIPEYVICPCCGNEIVAVKNAILIYKVIKDGR